MFWDFGLAQLLLITKGENEMATIKNKGLASLGRFFSGGAAGVAQKLGSAAQRGINAYTGGVSRLTSGAAQAGASGLGSFARSPGTLGGLAPSGGNTFTRVIPGNPQAQPQFPQGRAEGAASNYYDSWGSPGLPPRRPDPARGGSSSGGGGGVAAGGAGFAMDSRAIQEAIASYYAKQKEANEANEARYQQLLSIADATTGQRAKDVTSDFANQQSMAMQNLAGLGLANTSGASTIRGGFGRKKNEALDRLADTMQQTKLGIIERRTDAAPDLGSYTALAQLLGTAGGQERALRSASSLRQTGGTNWKNYSL